MNNYYYILLLTLLPVFVTVPMNNISDSTPMDNDQLSSIKVETVKPDEQLSRALNELVEDINQYGKISADYKTKIRFYQDLNTIARILQKASFKDKNSKTWKNAIQDLEKQDLAFIRKMLDDGLADNKSKTYFSRSTPKDPQFKYFVNRFIPQFHDTLHAIEKHNITISPKIQTIDNQIDSISKLIEITTLLEVYPKFLSKQHNQQTIHAMNKERQKEGKNTVQQDWHKEKPKLNNEKTKLLADLTIAHKNIADYTPKDLITLKNHLLKKRKTTIQISNSWQKTCRSMQESITLSQKEHRNFE